MAFSFELKLTISPERYGAISAGPKHKYRMLELARKMENEITESQYPDFYLRLREEMDDYYRARRRLRQVEENVEIINK